MIKTKKGDTIIEVTLAITIFSMVALAGVTLMNLGVSTAQASLQLVMAREAIDAQAEALRLIHNSYVATVSDGQVPADSIASRWGSVLSQKVDGASQFGGDATCEAMMTASGDKRFVIDVRNLRNGGANPVKTGAGSIPAANPATFARLVYGTDSNTVETSEAAFQRSEGIWIQAVPSVKDPVSNLYLAYDFHIRACWYAPGKSVPTTIGTIVRLYSSSDASSAISGDEPTKCVDV